MKLFGRFHEMSLNQVSLYHTPMGDIKHIMDKHPEMQVVIKEYKPKKNSREITQEIQDMKTGKICSVTDKIVFHPDYSKRHQVTLINDLGFLKISLYSEPMDYKDIERYLFLKPLPAVKKKEKFEQTLAKLDPNTAHERAFHVEHVALDGRGEAKKSKK